ncbi:nicotinate-nucleotide adenylyltransferase [Tepidiforma thermophila]|uniref:Probable nicotinate-nucleotide adenylyltransferase n=1 Tax=Tepidiforma thermophila (strain KCTC 52669 / CGMCC 1.13589 / G233) TaxID=2761530 RepID=A0A2A9HCS2_TEPT2|nr:nicotinate-nucleotide adenylyltransferase [Tepidiforma thermophila]PFG72930.1 nicotinate-nucleotide adenylyltransferase [Tepidiforma thermophila]
MAGGPLLIVGGTFDPPHLGHLVLAECARWQFGCGRVLFIPAGDPYRKTGTPTPENARAGGVAGRRVTPAALRLEMTRLATAGNPAFAVDARETRRPGPSYTVETLEELYAEGWRELVLVLGSDAAADLPNWRAPERIRELARVVVAEKAGAPAPAGFERVDMPRLEVSSTLIRERVRTGRPIRYLVPDAVAAFIEARGLYRDGD